MDAIDDQLKATALANVVELFDEGSVGVCRVNGESERVQNSAGETERLGDGEGGGGEEDEEEEEEPRRERISNLVSSLVYCTSTCTDRANCATAAWSELMSLVIHCVRFVVFV